MIKHVTYNGVEVPYSIGYYALKRFKGETGKDFEKTPDDDLEALEIIAWYAIEAGCKMEKIENPVDRNDIEMFLNECMNEFNESIPDFFQTPRRRKRPGHPRNARRGRAKTQPQKVPGKTNRNRDDRGDRRGGRCAPRVHSRTVRLYDSAISLLRVQRNSKGEGSSIPFPLRTYADANPYPRQ